MAHSERVLIRSLSVPATNCLMTLGCALARMHADKGCRGSCQGHGHGDNGTSLLQQQQPWCCYCDPTTAVAAAAGSDDNVPHYRPRRGP